MPEADSWLHFQPIFELLPCAKGPQAAPAKAALLVGGSSSSSGPASSGKALHRHAYCFRMHGRSQ